MDSREAAKIAKAEQLEKLVAIVVDKAYQLHRDLGPGLLESVYEAVLAKQLEQSGLTVTRQKSVSFHYAGLQFDEALRLDLLVEGLLIVEVKSVETLLPLHSKQVLTYLRLLDSSLGLLINFGSATFKEGCKRVVNEHPSLASSRLRVNN